jgi:hypothetical protein
MEKEEHRQEDILRATYGKILGVYNGIGSEAFAF